MGYSGPPAGQGLVQNEDGSVTTAGGYRISAEGNAEWKIFGPDGAEYTRVWGDPHVNESDGTTWDFSQDGWFVLPDGTRILADTDFEAGRDQSRTTALQIFNGADHATIDCVSGDHPTTSIERNGYTERARLMAERELDEFWMAGSGADDIQWVRRRNGQFEGEVIDGRLIQEGGRSQYDQVLNTDFEFDPYSGKGIDPSLRPEIGSPAWGNMFRGQVTDFTADVLRETNPYGLAPELAQLVGGYMQVDHAIAEQFSGGFGGWPNYFSSFDEGTDALQGLIALLRSDQDWRRQQHQSLSLPEGKGIYT